MHIRDLYNLPYETSSYYNINPHTDVAYTTNSLKFSYIQCLGWFFMRSIGLDDEIKSKSLDRGATMQIAGQVMRFRCCSSMEKLKKKKRKTYE